MSVYLNYSQEELDAQYDQRTLVPDLTPYMDFWTQASEEARQNLECRLDVSYGTGDVERLDLFLPTGDNFPIHVHFHGGAWRMLGKEHVSYPAFPFVSAGAAFVAVNFGLAPDFSLVEIIGQVRQAIKWIWDNADTFNGDRDRIYLSGHSSGAHLGATILAGGWRDSHDLPENVIKGCVLASGPYDLDPVRLSARNNYLNLDQEDADQLNPIRHIPKSGPPLFVCWGDGELAEFQRQGEAFAAAWRAADNECQSMMLATQNHFDVSLLFGQADSPVMKVALAQMSL